MSSSKASAPKRGRSTQRNEKKLDTPTPKSQTPKEGAVDRRKAAKGGKAAGHPSTPKAASQSSATLNISRRQSLKQGPASVDTNLDNIPNLPNRARPPSLVWDQTFNQLNTTSKRFADLQRTNAAYIPKLAENAKRLSEIIVRIKEIEKNDFGLDWDAVVASEKTGAVADEPVGDNDAEAEKDETSTIVEPERVLTRRDREAREAEKQRAAEARVQAIDNAKTAFELRGEQYVAEFKAKTKKRSRIPQAEAEERDGLLKEIQAISAQQAAWEKELLGEEMESEAGWAQMLANIAIDSGVAAPKEKQESPVTEEIEKVIDEEGQRDTAVESTPQTISEPAVISKQKKDEVQQNAAPLTQPKRVLRSTQITSLQEQLPTTPVVEEPLRRGTRTRMPSARKFESLALTPSKESPK